MKGCHLSCRTDTSLSIYLDIFVVCRCKLFEILELGCRSSLESCVTILEDISESPRCSESIVFDMCSPIIRWLKDHKDDLSERAFLEFLPKKFLVAGESPRKLAGSIWRLTDKYLQAVSTHTIPSTQNLSGVALARLEVMTWLDRVLGFFEQDPKTKHPIRWRQSCWASSSAVS